MTFILKQKIKFKHCDPAGIVFYPRYFEMINDCVEAFFEDELECSFSELHKIGGVPTAQISTIFKAPSFLGDVINIEMICMRIGGASLDLQYSATCNDETRFTASSTLVFVNKKGRPQSWTDELRKQIELRIGDENND